MALKRKGGKKSKLGFSSLHALNVANLKKETKR